jgi:hypothetical protein
MHIERILNVAKGDAKWIELEKKPNSLRNSFGTSERKHITKNLKRLLKLRYRMFLNKN